MAYCRKREWYTLRFAQTPYDEEYTAWWLLCGFKCSSYGLLCSHTYHAPYLKWSRFITLARTSGLYVGTELVHTVKGCLCLCNAHGCFHFACLFSLIYTPPRPVWVTHTSFPDSRISRAHLISLGWFKGERLPSRPHLVYLWHKPCWLSEEVLTVLI